MASFWHCIYFVGLHFRSFGDHWVSSSLKGAMLAALHLLVVLLCSAYRACSWSWLFKAPHPYPPFIIIFFVIVLFIIYLEGFPLSVTGAGTGAGAGFFWQA